MPPTGTPSPAPRRASTLAAVLPLAFGLAANFAFPATDSVSTATAGEGVAVVVRHSVVKSQASVSAERAGTLEEGDIVTVIEPPRAGYLRIRISETESGWVSARNVRAIDEAEVRRASSLTDNASLQTATLGTSVNVTWAPGSCDGRLLDKQFFTVCHAGDWRIPRWVTYRLTMSDLHDAAKRKDHFRADPELPEDERAELADYRGSGFARGHMAPADDFLRSVAAMDATFVLSNMSPQIGGLNSGRWRVLESETQTLARNVCDIWVTTGPLFLDASLLPVRPKRFIGPDHVAVPTHFFKAIFCSRLSGERELFGFVFANKAGLKGVTLDFAESIDRIEGMSGLDFFADLPDDEENRLEARKPSSWPPLR